MRVVALDLPTSWMMAAKADEFTGRMFEAINSMLLDMLAAVARKEYDVAPPPLPANRRSRRRVTSGRRAIGPKRYVAGTAERRMRLSRGPRRFTKMNASEP